MAQITFNIDMNIDFDISRRKSVSSSNKSSRESFMHSAASSVLYYKGMEIQSNNSLWSKQVEIEEIAFLYAMSAKENNIPVMSRSQGVDLVFSMFFSYFYFIFNLFSFILFLELGLGLE